MQVSLFSYFLPKERIAQAPASPRDHSRLLVLHRGIRKLSHLRFDSLPDLLRPRDVLVFNDSKVIKARLKGKKETGGMIEIFLLKKHWGKMWEVLVGGRGAHLGSNIQFAANLHGRLMQKKKQGWMMKFNQGGHVFSETINRIGEIPLPPYIKETARVSDYQTMFAKHKGSVAAPTAGLHFTKRLLRKLKQHGIQCEQITLHVGLGTFSPVKSKDTKDHRMHPEFATISPKTAERLNRAKKEDRRIIAVGTTSVRALEAFTEANGIIRSGQRDVKLFLTPGYRFKTIQGMITNFHLPHSTLLMLVSAFASRKKILNAYRIAIGCGYRFYSFGDAMLID